MSKKASCDTHLSWGRKRFREVRSHEGRVDSSYVYIILVSLTVMRILYYFPRLKLSIVAGAKLEKYPGDVSVRGISTILEVFGSRRR